MDGEIKILELKINEQSVQYRSQVKEIRTLKAPLKEKDSLIRSMVSRLKHPKSNGIPDLELETPRGMLITNKYTTHLQEALKDWDIKNWDHLTIDIF